jgi:hypothetical protein
MRLDGIGVNTIVKLGKGTIQIPGERQAMILILFEPLEFFSLNSGLSHEPNSKAISLWAYVPP